MGLCSARSWVDPSKPQFRRSFGYCSKPPSPPSSMMRTKMSRIAFAAIASACCVMANPSAAFAQVGAPELLIRIDPLENQIRLLTGQVEQMQYRNQQLEAALKRIQEDNDFRFQEVGTRGGPRVATARPGGVPPVQPAAPALGGRRSDAFDPAENPNAPGAPRTLGSIPSPSTPGAAARSDGSP